MTVRLWWRGAFRDEELHRLHAEGFGEAPSADPDPAPYSAPNPDPGPDDLDPHSAPNPGPGPDPWSARTAAHSLGWVCAREEGAGAGAAAPGGPAETRNGGPERESAPGRLIGFVNVVWDGGAHAFLLDTVVATDRRGAGLGGRLVERAVRGAREAGCEWLHVDYEPGLAAFYENACGFAPTEAGLLALRRD